MGYVKWSYDTLNTFCHDVFRKFGMGLKAMECREW